MKKLTTEKEIITWLRQMDVQDYRINEDLTVDVIGSTFLDRKNLTYFPVQFGTIGGNFYCQFNQLTSLEGAPHTVYGMFNCIGNQLTTLEFSPTKVNGDFRCSDNPLSSLEYATPEVKENFECLNCPLVSTFGLEKINIGKNFIHGWNMDTFDKISSISKQLENYYKFDKLSNKMLANISGIVLEKVKLEASINNTHEMNQNKKTLKI